MTGRRSHVEMILQAVRRQHRLSSVFVVVNTRHPDIGSVGMVVASSVEPELRIPPSRYRRVTTIPYHEFADHVRRWRRGEVVLLSFEDMPEPLRIRFSVTPLRWSLNVPLMANGEWIGLIGANTRMWAPSMEAVAKVCSARDRLMAEFEASTAAERFHGALEAAADHPSARRRR